MLGPEHRAIDKGKREMRRGSGTATLVAAIVMLAAGAVENSAYGNGLFEDRSWGFRDAASLSALILREDLRLKKVNDIYQPINPKVQYSTNATYGTYNNVTAGDNTNVDLNLDVQSNNSGSIAAGGELNGMLRNR
jgi:hypothetical protein